MAPACSLGSEDRAGSACATWRDAGSTGRKARKLTRLGCAGASRAGLHGRPHTAWLGVRQTPACVGLPRASS